MANKEDWQRQVLTISEMGDADVLLCNGSLERDIDEKIIGLCHSRRRRKNVILILVTEGGSPDVAYRIARTLQCLYSRFVCVISGYCKSAGTLLALGAHEIIFGHHGELGPLDVQMAKKDELMESESGLTVMTALTALHEKAMLAFEHFFIQTTVRGGGRLSVRTASQIATDLTRGLFGPISDQIDPLHVGEAWRSMTIAKAYGERLMTTSKNFSAEKLDQLISEYPSHGFVIDRLEAQDIFKNVREANESEQGLLDAFGPLTISPTKSSFVHFISDELPRATPNADSTENTANDESDSKPSAKAGEHVQADTEAGTSEAASAAGDQQPCASSSVATVAL